MNRIYVLAFVLVLAVFSSCNNGGDVATDDVITKKILYDVPFVNIKLEDRT